MYFEHQSQQGDNLHRDSDNNVYDFSDNLGYRETFLPMPTGQANDVNFYYIFTTNGVGNDCCTIGDNDNGTLSALAQEDSRYTEKRLMARVSTRTMNFAALGLQAQRRMSMSFRSYVD